MKKTRLKKNLKMKHEYAINAETIMVLPHYNENGFLNALICKKDGFSEADLSPFNLIDTNLRYRGSSLRGAMEGAQALLIQGTKNPVILDREQNIILFPSKSPFREDCIWFALHHVVDAVTIDKDHTQVELSNGSTILVDISKRSFDLKKNKAYELLFKMQTRNREFVEQVAETRQPYHLAKGEYGVNFEEGMQG
jgi:competence protein ComK